MGHRKHSAPRRGSLAYIPRGRVGDFFPTVHNWPRIKGNAPTLLGLPAVKVSTIHTITMDDREKTPNFGKPRFNPTSVLAVPDTTVVGLRLYIRENGAERAVGEVYAKTLPKGVEKKSGTDPEKFIDAWKPKLSGLTRISAIVAITPRDAGHLAEGADRLRGGSRRRRHRGPVRLRGEGHGQADKVLRGLQGGRLRRRHRRDKGPRLRRPGHQDGDQEEAAQVKEERQRGRSHRPVAPGGRHVHGSEGRAARLPPEDRVGEEDT